MKKTFLTTLFALVLCLVLLPASAFAASETVTYVTADGGTQEVEATLLERNASFPSGGTYLVRGDVQHTASDGLNFTGNTTLIFENGATLTVDHGLVVSGDLTVTTVSGAQSAALTVKDTYAGTSMGIKVNGNLNVYAGTVKATGGDVSNVKNGNSYGICASGGVSVYGGEVTATGGRVTAEYFADSYGIYAPNGVTVSGAAKVKATGGDVSTNAPNSNMGNAYSYGLYSTVGISVSGGEVTATGGTATASGWNKGSYGIYANSGMTIYGGTVKLTVGSTIKGTLTTSVSGKTLAGYLADGTAYEKDGSVVDGSVTELSNVKVVTHTHAYDSTGTCACGFTCDHTNVSDTGKCTTTGCGYQYPVKASNVAGTDVRWYASFDAAVSSAKGYIITLMVDVTDSNDWKISGTGFTLDLNGHKFGRPISVGKNTTEGLLIIEDSGTGGTVTSLTVNCGAAGISGGSFTELTWTDGCTVQVIGGSFEKITAPGADEMNGILETGYAFQHTGADTSMVKRGEYGATLTNVEVVKCSTHSAGTDGKCQYCNTQSAVKLTRDTTDTYYDTFNEAYEKAQSGDTITLQADAVHTVDSSSLLDGNSRDITLTIDLGTHTLTVKDGTDKCGWLIYKGNYTLKNGTVDTTHLFVDYSGSLTLGDSFSVNELWLGDAALNVTGDNVGVYRLHLVAAEKVPCALTKGSFGQITLASNAFCKPSGLLAEGYAFKTTDGFWYDKYNNSEATTISNVTVTAAPITSVTLAANRTAAEGQTCPTYPYGEEYDGGCVITTIVQPTDGNELTYHYYVDGGLVSHYGVTGEETTTYYCYLYNLSGLSVGTHTIYVKATKYGYTLQSNTVTVKIAKATLTESTDYNAPTAKTLTYNNGNQDLVSQGEIYSSGCTMYYKLGDGDWSDSIPTATDAGTYTVYWYIDGGDNYNDVGYTENPENIEVTIAPKPVTPTVTVDEGGTYDGTEKKPTVTVRDGNTTIPASNYTVSYSNNTNAGDQAKVTVTAKQGSNYTWTAVTENFSIGKATISITPPTVKNTDYNGEAQQLIATAGTVTGGTFYYRLGESGEWTTDITTLTATNAGSYTIYYYVEGDANHWDRGTANLPVGSITASIHKINLSENCTFTLDQTTYTYDGTAKSPTVTVTYKGKPLTEGTDYTVTGRTSETEVEGYYLMQVVATDNGNFTGQKPMSWHITAAPLTITGVTATDKSYDGTTDAAVSVTFGGLVNGETLTAGTDYTVSGTFSDSNAGENKTVTAAVTLISSETAANYTLTGSVPTTKAAIKQKVVGLNWTDTSLTYNGNAQKPTATATGLVNGDVCTITVTGEQTNAGENYTATATALSNSNYKLPEANTKNFSIGKAAAPPLTAADTEIIYTQTPYTVDLSKVITGMPTDAGTVSYSLPDGVNNVAISGGTLTISEQINGTAGASITASVIVSSANYANATVTVTIRLIAKTAKALSVSMSGWTYGDAAGTPGYGTLPEGAGDVTVKYVGCNGTTYAESTTVPTDAGDYTVSVYYETDTEIWSGTADFTIRKKTISIASISESSKTYDGTNAAPADMSLTFGGLIGAESLTAGVDYAFTARYGSADVGEKTIDVTVTLQDTDTAKNYEMLSGTQGMPGTIVPKPITVTVTAENKTYDGSTAATASTVTFAGLQNGERLSRDTDYTVTATFANANCNMGNPTEVSYTVTLKDSETAKNYSLSTGTGTTTAIIQPKSVTATITVADKEYDGTTTATVTVTVNKADLCGDDSITLSGLTGEFSDANVGDDKTVTIKGALYVSSDNYSVSYSTNGITASIKPARASVTTAPRANTLTYTGAAQTLATAGSASGGTMQYSLNGTDWSDSIPTGINATGYTVWYRAKGDSNHSDTQPVSIPVTIGKAALTVTANDKTITYGEAPANSGVTCSGFVNGETESVLGGTLGYDYSYTQFGNVGNNYTITPKGLSSDNYSISYVPGTLTVNAKEVGLSWTNTSLTYTGSAQKPTATATDLVNGDSCTVTVSGEKTSAGDDYTATAVSLSNSNYRLPEGVTTSFSIGNVALTGVSVSQTGTLTYNGSAQTATVATAGITVDGSTVSFTYSTEQNGAYSAAVPAFASGKHTVYYRASAANHVTCGGNFEITVNKVSVTITAENKNACAFSPAPDLANPVLGIDYAVSGLIGEDTLGEGISVLLTCDVDMKKPGTYDIVPSVIGEDERYDFEFVNGKLTVFYIPISSSEETTVKNPDGSITTISKDKETGTVTEKTTTATGTTATTVADSDGTVTDIEVVISKSDAAANGTVSLPIENVNSSDSATAPKIDVEIPKNSTVTIEIPVKNPTAGTVAVVVNPDGTETVISTAKVTENGLELTLESSATIKIIDNAKKFTDVPDEAWYAEAVAWASARDITGGVGNDRFAPDDSCTRAQIVTFLWRAAGSPKPAEMSSFADVSANAYYAEAVAWAVEQNITTGTGDTTFSPEATCTRAQAVAFLFRYAAANGMEAITLQELVSSFNDAAEVPAYALPAFNWALANEIVEGAYGKLMPNDNCTRSQIVTMLYRLLG